MAKVRVKDDSDFDSITMNLRQLNNSKIQIGIFGEDDSFEVMKATVHEFGVKIKVTPKMRTWFAFQGYPLSPSTTSIQIPERSFLRATFDEEGRQIERMGLEEIVAVMSGQRRGHVAADRYGLKLAALVQEKMTQVSEPALSGMTKARRKGSGESANALVDEGKMRQSITHKVE